MNVQEKLRDLARDVQADYFGVASLDAEPVRDFIRKQGGELVSGYPFAIAIGMALPGAIVDLLPKGPVDLAVRASYKHHAYDVVNSRLDLAASSVAALLQREGHRAFPIPASQTLDTERLLSLFSNKLAPHLAGLGWIGRSCMVITTDRGPRVRWTTVLTDAPLAPTGEPMAQRCGACHACVEICPAHAYTGKAFDEAEPREARFNPQACKAHIEGLGARGINPPICGLCLYVCPHGRRKGTGSPRG